MRTISATELAGRLARRRAGEDDFLLLDPPAGSKIKPEIEEGIA